jgi:putative two-component system response regulator
LDALSARLVLAVDGDHARRVGHYVKLLSLQMGLGSETAHQFGAAAALHDVGKICVPDSVLHKPAPLNTAEWDIVKKHPMLGASLLSGGESSIMNLARQVALAHHEHFDGTGYPHGLKGEEIPLAARITTLADRYDALRSHRAYKPAFNHGKTTQILLNGDGRSRPEHFDPRVLEAFRATQDRFNSVDRSPRHQLAQVA